MSSPAEWGASHGEVAWQSRRGQCEEPYGPAQSGAEPAWEGALLPWSLTSLLQGSQDSFGGFWGGLELPSPQASGAKCHPSLLGMDARDPGEHSWECEKAQPRINGLQRAQGPVQWRGGGSCPHVRQAPGQTGPSRHPTEAPKGLGSGQAGSPWPCRASSRKDMEDSWTSVWQGVHAGWGHPLLWDAVSSKTPRGSQRPLHYLTAGPIRSDHHELLLSAQPCQA